jgi:hypothetical protein
VSKLKDDGIRFVLARSRATFEEQLSRTGQDDVLPPGDRFPTVRAAVTSVAGVEMEAPHQ